MKTTTQDDLAKGIDKFYADKEERRSYTMDKRVKHWDNCDCCKTPISSAMAKRNGGFCGICVKMYQ